MRRDITRPIEFQLSRRGAKGRKIYEISLLATSLSFFFFLLLFYETSLYREIPRPDDNFLLEVGGKRGKRWRKEGEETDTGIFLPGRESRREGS